MKNKLQKETKIHLLVGLLVILSFNLIIAVTGPDSLTSISNETKGTVGAYTFNISGGYISTFNITSTTQNSRWKGFVGNVSGSFTLDDSSGSTLYDWSLTTIGGEIYATRNSSSISWSTLACASVANLEAENTAMSHTNADDNITKTFSGENHTEFFVSTKNISQDSCNYATLNTYVNNASQEASFEEVALYEAAGANIVYATIMETDVAGFDGNQYDFQMIVPEDGTDGFDGATAYYLYVELS